MNYILKYYYDIENISIINRKGHIYIRTPISTYIFQEIYDINLVNYISEIIDSHNLESNFYKIIKTKYNKIYAENKNRKYVLLKIIEKNSWNIKNKIPIRIDEIKYKCLNRSNWYFLWIRKNDNIKNVILEKKENNNISEIYDYFNGISENAILYYKQISSLEVSPPLYISQERVDKEYLGNPLNIVIDRRERDIAEVIKYLYFNNENYNCQLNELIGLAIKENLSLEIIFSRVLYPTNYFDFIEKKEDIDITFLNKLLNYEKFLKDIYNKFSTKKTIKKIDWL